MVMSAMRTVMQTLRAEGFPVRHAYPGSRMCEIDRTVAAVEMEELDQQAGTTTIRINVMTPAELGTEDCEADALDMCYVLHVAGAVCRMQRCRFLRDANLFQIVISAVFQGIQ